MKRNLGTAKKTPNHLLIFAFSATFLTSCVSVDFAKQKYNAAKPVNNGFAENERQSDDGNRLGTTPNGSKYSYRVGNKTLFASLTQASSQWIDSYSHIASAGDWVVQCSINAMSDLKECELSNHHDITMYGPSLNELNTLCLDKHDFPGEIAYIRFAQEKPVNLGTDGCIKSKTVVKKFLSVPDIAVSYVPWPRPRIEGKLRNHSVTDISEYVGYLDTVS